MKVEALPGFEGLRRGRWNGLLGQARHPSVFLSWQWQTAWTRAFLDARPLHLLRVTDDAGTLAGLLPLYDESPGLRRFVGGVDVSDYLDLIAPAGREEDVWQALLQQRAGETAEWDLHAIRAASPTLEILPRLCRRGRAPRGRRARGTLSRARAAGVLGRLPRAALGQGPPRAAAQDPKARARAAGHRRCARTPRPRAGTARWPHSSSSTASPRSARRASWTSAWRPSSATRPSALAARGLGAAVVPRLGRGGGGELPLPRVPWPGGRLGRSVQLGLRSRPRQARARASCSSPT